VADEATTAEPVVPAQAATEAAPVPLAAPAVPPPPPWIYALGQVDARYPSLAVEKEFAQATAGMHTAGLTERQVIKAVISERRNRYLARQLCWLLLVQGLEAYVLMPTDPADYHLLIEAYRGVPSPEDVDLAVGTRGPIAPPELCNGVGVPIVAFDQLYSFDRPTLVNEIPVPSSVTESDDEAQFRTTARSVFTRIWELADNVGAIDEHRALNYLAVRYPRLYTEVALAHERDASLSAIDVRPSPLSGVRRVVDVILSFTSRETDVTDKLFARVDVTEEYPFLVTKLSPYYDR
jgi:hypothetical protein